MPANFKREIVTYLLLLVAFSSVFYYFIISTGTLHGGGGLYVTGLMWSPATAAIGTRLLYHGNLRGMGWGWGKPRYLVLSYFLPVLYGSVAYGIVWALGLGKVNLAALPNPLWKFVLVGSVLTSTRALGEEIGWRGFLVPQLAKVLGYTKTSFISGLLWASWHFPILLFADYNNGTPPLYGLLCFTVMVVGISFTFNWIRLKSGSLWTAMLLHATHNLYIQGLFDPITVDTGFTKYLTGEFGAALALVSVVLACVFWRQRGSLAKIFLQSSDSQQDEPVMAPAFTGRL